MRFPGTADLRKSSEGTMAAPRRRGLRAGLAWAYAAWLAIGLAGVGPTAVADEGDDAYDLAVGFYKKSRWDLAENAFRSFLVDHPNHGQKDRARRYLGLTLINLAAESQAAETAAATPDEAKAARTEQERRFKEARELFRKLTADLAGDPTSVLLRDAVYRVGECSYFLNDFAAAEKELAAFAARYPKDSLRERTLALLGESQMRQKKYDAAIATYTTALKEFENGSYAEDCRLDLARAYEATNKIPEAIALYERVANDPQSVRAAEALLNLAARHFDDRKYPAAVKVYGDFEKRFPEHPDLPIARLNLGKALHLDGKSPEAVKVLERVGGNDPLASEANYWRALALKAGGDRAAARKLLEQEWAARPGGPLAERTLYLLAEYEQEDGALDAALGHFRELQQKWPRAELADDALHRAAALAVDQRDLVLADKLLAQFQAEYASSGLIWHHENLRGRLQLLKNQPQQALAHFDRVLRESRNETTRQWALFYRAASLAQLKRDAEVLSASEPLVEAVQKQGADSPLAGVLVLRAQSALALARQTTDAEEKKNRFRQAAEASNQYLQLAPQGAQRPEALASSALASAALGSREAADRALQELSKIKDRAELADRASIEVAELAYARQEWDWASELFQAVVAGDKSSRWRAQALSGLGWIDREKRQYASAARRFEQVVKECAESPLAGEAEYLWARSLEDAGELEAALPVYQRTFQGSADAERAYRAGRQAAAVLARLQRAEESDAAYRAVAERFAKPGDLDQFLAEWAEMNYAAERYDQADAVYAQLLKKCPESEFVDNAKFRLAESDLLRREVEKARAVFETLAADAKSDPAVVEDSLYQLSIIAMTKQDWTGLKTTASRLIEKFPEGQYARHAGFLAANAELNLGDAKSAAARLAELVEYGQSGGGPGRSGGSAPGREWSWFGDAFVLLAEAQLRLKDYAGVERTAAALRGWDAESPRLYLVDEILGRAYKNQAKFDQAREAFGRVVSSKHGRRTETAAKSQFLIAETFFIQKQYQTAEQEYLKVEILYKYPEWQAAALFQAAGCQEHRGQWAQAVRTYEMLAKDYGKTEIAKQVPDRLKSARMKVM